MAERRDHQWRVYAEPSWRKSLPSIKRMSGSRTRAVPLEPYGGSRNANILPPITRVEE